MTLIAIVASAVLLLITLSAYQRLNELSGAEREKELRFYFFSVFATLLVAIMTSITWFLWGASVASIVMVCSFLPIGFVVDKLMKKK